LANLFEYFYIKEGSDPKKCVDAIRNALRIVEGAYGLLILCKDVPKQLIAAKKGSPIVVGIGDQEYFIASDASPIVEYTNSVIYLKDDDIAILSDSGLSLINLKNIPQTPNIHKLDLSLDQIEKNGFDHYMLKEIYEQPR